jgi:hypothetical protein
MAVVTLRKRSIFTFVTAVTFFFVLVTIIRQPQAAGYINDTSAPVVDWVKSKISPEPAHLGPDLSLKEEIFPLAKEGGIPKINGKNVAKDVGMKTPLFIGFGRNWNQLQQAVVSYITAGWPADQIIIVDNTGVMDSNVSASASSIHGVET